MPDSLDSQKAAITNNCIREIYSQKLALGDPVISFEFFPPQTVAGKENLYKKVIPALSTANPDFCSVTYGAGGSMRSNTLEVVEHIQTQYGITGMAHVTFLSSTQEEIKNFIQTASRLNIKNLLALRGDPPRDDPDFVRLNNNFEYAFELIDYIKTQGAFSIGVAGFPEGHIDCKGGKHLDWNRLKDKIDHGADFVLSQLFFENADYFEFRDYLVDKLGVRVPITPGILPILNGTQVKRFADLCGARLPAALVRNLDKYGDDNEAMAEFGIDYATRQCDELLKNSAPGLHLYSLNKSRSSLQILRNLGLT